MINNTFRHSFGHIFGRSFRLRAVSIAVVSVTLSAQYALAQTATQTATQSALKEVIVTGNPLGATEIIAPTSKLTGDELTLRAKATLGETLDNTSGVSSTYFGPNASRPIVRGLDGDRIRILQNSGANIDASALSFDHAVPNDPISIERIEVLRGAGALQYGGSAVGGVVNVIDNRIPTESQFDAKGGVSGRADLGYATGSKEKSGAVLLEAGNHQYVIHADVSARQSSDVAVPTELECSKPGRPDLAKKICNSANDVKGGAVGGSLLFENGYVGASIASYKSNYGTVAEDEVTIGMKSNRLALEGELRNLGGLISSIKGQLSYGDYQHTEFEGDDASTVFKNKGTDLRITAKHGKLGGFEGVVGLHSESTQFSADGAESFAPYSQTTQTGLFVVEEMSSSWGKLSMGARADKVKVTSKGNAGAANPDNFPPGSRSFTPVNLAAGALVKLSPTVQLTANLAHTQRVPKDYELYANGPHIATAAWETGERNLGLEKSNSLDVGLAIKNGAHKFAFNAYTSQFSNFISLEATGNTKSTEGEFNPAEDGLTDTAYRGVRARFTGFEASGTLRLLGKGGLAEATGQTLDLDLRADAVRATNTSTGQALPRIAPMRVGATAVWGAGSWGARLGFDHAFAQNRVPDVGQRATSAYTLWNAAVTYKMKAGPSQLTWFAKVDNLTNQLAYSASSILTTTAFPKAPLPGRSLKIGVQVNF
ncbi:MAG TPA: TonB-dependent receptor [Burkholderiaceae bacterium]|nr:TonB-dependent receptor [Burkholderiaceae bacterium]